MAYVSLESSIKDAHKEGRGFGQMQIPSDSGRGSGPWRHSQTSTVQHFALFQCFVDALYGQCLSINNCKLLFVLYDLHGQGEGKENRMRSTSSITLTDQRKVYNAKCLCLQGKGHMRTKRTERRRSRKTGVICRNLFLWMTLVV